MGNKFTVCVSVFSDWCLVDGYASVWYNWSHVGECVCASKTLIFGKISSSESSEVQRRGETRRENEQSRTENEIESETERIAT